MARFATAGTRARKIAAIDFGTTHCSLAYTLSDDTHIVNMGLNWAQERVPTAILLKRTGEGSFTVEKFGTQAQDEISKLGMEQHEYVYFECFKMKLRHEEVRLVQARLIPVERKRNFRCVGVAMP